MKEEEEEEVEGNNKKKKVRFASFAEREEEVN